MTTISTVLDHASIMEEYAQIRTGVHPSWTGDRIANSDVTGLPPRTLTIASYQLIGLSTWRLYN